MRMDVSDGLRIGGCPTLYHGTSARRARSILRDGFFRLNPKGTSASQKALCASESVTVAAEFGFPLANGVLFEIIPGPSFRWFEFPESDGRCFFGDAAFESFLGRLMAEEVGAVRTFGGNVWLILAPSSLASFRALPTAHAMTLIREAIVLDGPNRGYNGCVEDFAEVLRWKRGECSHEPTGFAPQVLARYARYV